MASKNLKDTKDAVRKHGGTDHGGAGHASAGHKHHADGNHHADGKHQADGKHDGSRLAKGAYEKELYRLQAELVKMQEWTRRSAAIYLPPGTEWPPRGRRARGRLIGGASTVHIG